MSDYLYCISRPEWPGLVEIHTSRDDPRRQSSEAVQRRRGLGEHYVEWTLPVVDRALTEAALLKVLRKHRDRKAKTMFACDPMEARGEAIKLTTLRPDMNKRRKGQLIAPHHPRGIRCEHDQCNNAARNDRAVCIAFQCFCTYVERTGGVRAAEVTPRIRRSASQHEIPNTRKV